jgi:hypothetical protein
MLDFQKVIRQIGGVGIESVTEKFPIEEIRAAAQEAYLSAADDPSQFAERMERNAPYVLWPVLTPLEPLGTVRRVPLSSAPVTVVATDGSQIMPSHHEIYNCYLLNVGVVVITYGVKFPPILDTRPTLYHRPEELYPLVDRRRMHIDELYVSLERNLLELQTLCETALQSQERGAPVVALLDGTLIPWSVEKMPDGYQTGYVQRLEQLMERFREARIPLVGYLSHSRAADVVNALRVWTCPYSVSNCREMCGALNEEDFPCSKMWPLADRQLLSPELRRNERTGVFLSGAPMARRLDSAQAICFMYLNVGQEIARLELPRWLFDDPELLELSASTILSQAEKGKGYPVALSESHHLAVIKGPDRQRFFELLSSHLVGLGVNRVKVSPKESRKRKGIV